ncbi:MAG TPA: type II secretion system protein GspE, partial [Desulfobacteraceae bacterium]|nr:type II secretion system protein GspE [Desulfobacteraceae bacterium]
IAQRLVRRLCPHCKEKETLDEVEQKSLGLVQQTVFKAMGCSRCFHTGYAGREAIFEILELDDAIKKMILNTSDANEIMAAALEKGMRRLRRNGIEKVLKGITTVEEVLRVTQE